MVTWDWQFYLFIAFNFFFSDDNNLSFGHGYSYKEYSSPLKQQNSMDSSSTTIVNNSSNDFLEEPDDETPPHNDKPQGTSTGGIDQQVIWHF